MCNKMESPSQVVMGGLYKAHPDRVGALKTDGYNQSYGLFIPFAEETSGTIWMIDTYHISSPSLKKEWEGDTRADRFINGFVSDEAPKSRFFISECIYDCYYNDCVKLTKSNCREFEFLGRLSDYREVSDRKARDYEEEDVLEGVKLWREHGYPSGICLVRKDACTSGARELDALIAETYNRLSAPSIFWNRSEMEKIRATLEEYDDVKLQAAYYIFDKAEQMQKEWREFTRDVRMLESTGELDSFATWEAGVPASDICA